MADEPIPNDEEKRLAALSDEALTAEVRHVFGEHTLIDTRERTQLLVLGELQRRLMAAGKVPEPGAAQLNAPSAMREPVAAQLNAPSARLVQNAGATPDEEPLIMELELVADDAGHVRRMTERQRAFAEVERLPAVEAGGIFGDGMVPLARTKAAYHESAVYRDFGLADEWLTEEITVDPVESGGGIFPTEPVSPLEPALQCGHPERAHPHAPRWMQALVVLLILAVAALVTMLRWGR